MSVPACLRPALLVAFCAAVLAGCQQASSDASFAPSSESAAASSADAAAAGPGGTASASATPADTADTAARRITVGQATVEVADVKMARANLLAATRLAGGYVGSEEAVDRHDARRTTLTLRLPAARAAAFDAVLDGLGRVTERSTQVEDVSAAYTDVASRLTARRAVEARYLALLGNARTTADILAVEAALKQIHEDIESAEGQIRLWDQQVAYSTLTVSLAEPGAVDGDGEGFRARVDEALRDSLGVFEALLLLVLRTWPVLLLVALALGLWRRRTRRLRRATSADAPGADTGGADAPGAWNPSTAGTPPAAPDPARPSS